MIKRILLFVLQFVAFLFLLGVGGYWDIVRLLVQMQVPSLKGPLGLFPLVKFQVTSQHNLVANGLIFAGILWLVILLIEVLRKVRRDWMILTTVAFVLAVVIGFANKLGLPPVS